MYYFNVYISGDLNISKTNYSMKGRGLVSGKQVAATTPMWMHLDLVATQLQEYENCEGRERRFCFRVMAMSVMDTVCSNLPITWSSMLGLPYFLTLTEIPEGVTTRVLSLNKCVKWLAPNHQLTVCNTSTGSANFHHSKTFINWINPEFLHFKPFLNF